ncbi:GreA/GreB family elongation factor [uncultured Sphingomonas sp.]|uniref:GreA/GreB family elongation factor n=1 Tax=uncultured Sphingomonas sp. TaxID=158754 RepID=UPI0025EA505B|nr:GreA/GreB family elongation factor [uncultured Sphingomonas sp.]
MSVAFRREDDDAHREPTFELPLPPGPNLVTARGLALIEARVAELEAAVEAASGDEQKALRRDLRYWHARASTAEVQPAPAGNAVAFGTRVTYRLNGQTRTVTLVGSDEANVTDGAIPFTAPIAQAMMDAEPGEAVDYQDREGAIEVVGVAPA